MKINKDTIELIFAITFWCSVIVAISLVIGSCRKEVAQRHKLDEQYRIANKKAVAIVNLQNAKAWTKFYDGEHELFSINTMISSYSKSSGSSKLNGNALFVAIVGGASIDGTSTQSSESGMIREVTFSFKTINDEYLVAKFPIDIVRFHIIRNDEKPFVRFGYTVQYKVPFNEMEWQKNITKVMLYLPESAITHYSNLDLK